MARRSVGSGRHGGQIPSLCGRGSVLRRYVRRRHHACGRGAYNFQTRFLKELHRGDHRRGPTVATAGGKSCRSDERLGTACLLKKTNNTILHRTLTAMKKRILVLVVMLLSACAAPRLSSTAEQQIKSVGIVSLIPEEANFIKIGLTAFNNEHETIAMDGKITSTVEETLVKALANLRPNWSVKPIAYDRNALISRMQSGFLVMRYQEERIEKELSALARANQMDALIVVSPYRPENVHGDGVGVTLRTFSLFSIGSAYVNSYIFLTIVDPKGEVIAMGHDRDAMQKAIDPKAYGIQYKLADNHSPELLAKLRAAILEQVSQSVQGNVKALGL
jgi:hypothetical protein